MVFFQPIWKMRTSNWIISPGRNWKWKKQYGFFPKWLLRYFFGKHPFYIYVYIYIYKNKYIYIYIYDGGLRPPSPPPPRMGWVQNLRFSYIFMEPAETHGIYTVLTSSASETVVFAAFCNTTLYTTTLIVLLLQKQQQLLLLLPLLRTTTYYYVLLRTTTYYYVLLRTTTNYYVLLRTTYYYVLRTTTYYYVLLRTIKTPPTHPQGGGAGTLCVYVISLFAYTIKMIYLPCVHMYIHTYKQTINQYKQIVIIHKSIETYSYTYRWLQMVRPPQPTHRGGGGNIMCICSIFVCIHNKNDIPTLRAHVHTYIQTNHKAIQTKSSHT